MGVRCCTGEVGWGGVRFIGPVGWELFLCIAPRAAAASAALEAGFVTCVWVEPSQGRTWWVSGITLWCFLCFLLWTLAADVAGVEVGTCLSSGRAQSLGRRASLGGL